MLNIGKLGPDAAAYYLESVASGVEDYYLHAGEAPGQWVGASSAALGLRGEVSGADLMRLLSGVHPATGEHLGRANVGPGRLPGYDLTFRAPKSVSLLFALSEGELPREVKLAHEEAVSAALGYLEREAAFSRRRVDGVIVPVRGEGFAAAAFQHRTSRAGDPLLHHHVLVANVVRDAEGQWGAVDGRLIYAQAKTAGYLYQAELRAQLSRRLAVRWTPVVRGTAEVQGIPVEVIRAFSRRRGQILARMAERGEWSAKAAQVATLDTRRAKDHEVTPQGLLPEWRARAAALGLSAEAQAAVVRRPGGAPGAPPAQAMAKTLAALGAPNGLTAHSSTFTRRDVIRVLCERLGPGADAATVEDAADRFLGTPGVVAVGTVPGPVWGRAVLRLASGRVVPALPDECRFTTEELLRTERRLIAGCLRRNAQARSAALRAQERARPVVGSLSSYPLPVRGPAPVSATLVEAALGSRPFLSDEQRQMVRRLTTSGDAVSVVRGHAGTGKTSALDACRDIWQRSGRTVVGCALSGRAAAELQGGAGIASTTIDRLLLDLIDDDDEELLPWGEGVIVVDEAGMVGTRLLARLLRVAEQAEARVVLVGDDRQLPEIDAGGAYRGLCERLGAVELTVNRRQREEWERQALVLIREGKSQEALAAYLEHGRVVVGSCADSVRARLVADWWAAEQSGGGDNVMVALRRADVGELNQRARALRLAAGDVGGATLSLPTGEFAAGDRVVTTRNRRRLGVVNGSRGTVQAVDEQERTLTIRLDGHRGDQPGRLAVLPAEYLEAGHLEHGYAITGHKAQGMTADRAFVLGDEAMYREWGYVALSRGREENRLYVVAPDLETLDDAGHGAAPSSPTERHVMWLAARALAESREHHLALDRLGGDASAAPRRHSGAGRWPQEMDDSQLREAAAVAAAVLEDERRPELAEPELTDRSAAIERLTAEQRRLSQRRARLSTDIAAGQARLGATGGPLGRRRHREERDHLQRDTERAVRETAAIGRQLSGLEQRLGRLRTDEALESAWSQRQRNAASRWYGLRDEANRRIARRAQAAAAAPSAAGHDALPAELGAEREWWWSSAYDTERERLWDGVPPSADASPLPAVIPQGDHRSMGTPPDVINMLGRVDAAETAHRRIEGPRERAELDGEDEPDLLAQHHHREMLAQHERAVRGPILPR